MKKSVILPREAHVPNVCIWLSRTIIKRINQEAKHKSDIIGKSNRPDGEPVTLRLYPGHVTKWAFIKSGAPYEILFGD